MTFRERRVLFSRLIAEIMLWINAQPGWQACFDEVMVHSPRTVRHGGKKYMAEDGVHKARSFHHSGLAADLNLYVNGQWIIRGDHPAWKLISRRWEGMHPECTAGIRFDDSNHLSLGEGSRSTPLP